MSTIKRIHRGRISYRLDDQPENGVIALPVDPRTVDADHRYGPWVDAGYSTIRVRTRLRPELKQAAAANWEHSRAAYQHLAANGDAKKKRPDPTKLQKGLRQR